MDNIAFEDYYEDLQVSYNADSETIERVYRLLAKRYHPDNSQTGNVDKFNIITKAYKILLDFEQRAAYDATYEEKKIHQWRAIAAAKPAGNYEDDEYNRRCLLSILYIKCRENPLESGIGLWCLEQMLGWPQNLIEFHFWYLKEKDYIKLNDNSQLTITVNGVDRIEKDGLILIKDKLLTESTETDQEIRLIS